MELLFVSGMPCSGKTYEIKKFLKKEDIPHIKIGDIVRHIASIENMTVSMLCPAPSYLCKFEDAVRAKLTYYIGILDRIGTKKTIIDGFPRNREQYYFMKRFLRYCPEFKAKICILDIDTNTATDRMLARKRKGDTVARITSGRKDIEIMSHVSGILPTKELTFVPYE